MKYDKIEMIAQRSDDGTIYDVSDIVTSITTTKEINNTAGKITFSLNTSVQKIRIPMGSTISFKVFNNGVSYGKFFGFVFQSKPKGDTLEITAYDQLRYLKNNESYVLTGMTLERLVALICNDFNLRPGTIEGSKYILPKRVEDGKALGDIIQRAIDFTLQGTKKQYIIRDEFGYLACRDISKLVTNIIIGDSSLLNSYDYSESIDSDTYNSIKLYKDNKKTGKREVYIAKDSNTIKQWGKLQLFESVDEEVTDAQARTKAQQLLYLNNKVLKKITLQCYGVLDLEVGMGIRLQLNDIPEIALNQNALITKIDDTYTNGIHTMELEVGLE